MSQKLLFISSIVLLNLFFCKAQSFRIATYNIRYDNPDDSLDRWTSRCPHVASLIKLYDFDIVGTQVGLYHQLQDLKKVLSGYDYIGIGRNNGVQAGEHSAIFYKTNNFKLLDKGNFWLSAITDKPNKGWDAALPRICSWGKFSDIKTGVTFFAFNVHFDHRGEQARIESAKLILEQIRKIAGASPVFLTGDFNVNERHGSYTILNTSGLLKDAYNLTEFRYAPDGTFNGFNINNNHEGRIDHIFLGKGFTVRRYGILTNTYNGRYPSDHFPVMAEVSYGNL
jgi:endonuclease/exonuclease/phosphatase family metal-dependent hydrolase